ncbi:hypothetical protein H8S21_19250 [Erwinia persicina]|nr:colicin-like bacteriocin tRNase domain-containing protein [Erwinia persicina]MBC3947459.1 hypothetical protein [Erwinia persicina]
MNENIPISIALNIVYRQHSENILPPSGRPVGGNGNNGGQNGSGGNASSSDGKTLSVFGMPAIAVPVNGVWGITLFDTAAIAGEITDAIAALDKALAVAPYAARTAGVFGLLAPSPLGTC